MAYVSWTATTQSNVFISCALGTQLNWNMTHSTLAKLTMKTFKMISPSLTEVNMLKKMDNLLLL